MVVSRLLLMDFCGAEMPSMRKDMSLIEQYRRLSEQGRSDDAAPTAGADVQLDELYSRIVSSSVDDIHSALEKLWFAHYCLTKEDDFKEAANLIQQVCLALEKLTPDPDRVEAA